jgi:hypothetical protein
VLDAGFCIFWLDFDVRRRRARCHEKFEGFLVFVKRALIYDEQESTTFHEQHH